MKSFPIYVDTLGRPCSGCTKCCEGWLYAKIYDFEISPTEGSCKFLGKHGCGIYPVRETLCKNFQCEWKENSQIPEYMKPDKSNVIILTKRLEKFVYRRLVTAGTPIKDYVYTWVEEEATKGRHSVVYSNLGELLVISKDQNFIDRFLEYNKTGV